MVKKVVFITLTILMFGYLAFAVAYLNPKAKQDLVCNNYRIQVLDTLERRYLSEKDISLLLEKAGLIPIGKNVSSINTEDIKTKLEENRLIKRVDCFKTIDGTIMIKIHQKIPILRVFSENGSYYVDNEGETMPVPQNFAAYVPVASGNIDENYAKEELYPFAQFLEKDKFWNSQIEQIYITSNKDVELTPRVGNHQIILGKLEDYPENLEKLRLFYEKGLNKIGWNKYSVINLKYKNQVVCTKVDKS